MEEAGILPEPETINQILEIPQETDEDTLAREIEER
jgi:hypothetical protein